MDQLLCYPHFVSCCDRFFDKIDHNHSIIQIIKKYDKYSKQMDKYDECFEKKKLNDYINKLNTRINKSNEQKISSLFLCKFD